MAEVVLDPSLALRWVLPGEQTPSVDRILQQWLAGGVRFVVPELFWAEIANGLYQSIRRNRITLGEAEAGFHKIASMVYATRTTTPSLILSAFQMASAARSDATYDYVYVALAGSLGIEMWHSDERLHKRAQGQYPWVRCF